MFHIDTTKSIDLMLKVLLTLPNVEWGTQKTYRFKSSSDGKYMIILQLCDDSITDENRFDIKYINRGYASYRASKAKVILIVNKMDINDRPTSIVNTWANENCVYTVGEISYPDDFSPVGSSASQGIHYYLFPYPAICFGINVNNAIIDSIHMIWDEDGNTVQYVQYKNGQINGRHIHYDHGIKLMVLEKKNGIFHGRSEYYYRDGSISQIFDYDNGKCIKFINYDKLGNEIKSELGNEVM